MAYLPPSKWDEEQQKAAGTPADQQQPSLGSAPAPSSTPSSGTAPPPATPQQPNSFPGISSYLSANPDSGKAMGQQIDNRIGGEVSQAQDEYTKSKQGWQAGNQTAADQWNQATQDAQAQNRDAYTAWQNQVNNTVRSRLALEYGPEGEGSWNPKEGFRSKISDYTSGKEFTAPTPQAMPTAPTLTAYSSPWDSGLQTGHSAETELGLLGSDAGRQTVLQQMAKDPTYSQGMGALDSALLGPTLGSDLSQKYSGILGALKTGAASPDASPAPSPYGDSVSRPAALSPDDVEKLYAQFRPEYEKQAENRYRQGGAGR